MVYYHSDTRVSRGNGYCITPDCEQYAKGKFTLGIETYQCPVCQQIGHLESESQSPTVQQYDPERAEGVPYKKVEVMYDFCGRTLKYRATAIVQDDALATGRTHYMRNPLIMSEKRALTVAEHWLGALQMANVKSLVDQFGRQLVFTLDTKMSREEWTRKLDEWSTSLRASDLVTNNGPEITPEPAAFAEDYMLDPRF